MPAEAWDTVRVFVSSTFHDMHAERDHLVRFVFPRLRERLLARRIRLVDVDLRWGVVSGEDVTAVCKEAIDRCRPWFVALLGQRYGSILPGTGQSVTELEIEYAAFTLDRPVRPFFYFRDAGALECVPPDFAPLYSERSASTHPGEAESDGDARHRRDRLTALKGRIAGAGLTTRTYSATWSADFQCFGGLHDFGRQVEDDLWSGIASWPPLSRRFSDHGRAAEDIDFDDFFDPSAVNPWFGQREELRERFGALATGTRGAFVLRGAPGSGKTSTLLGLCNDLAEARVGLFSYFAGRTLGASTVTDLLNRLLRFLDRGTDPPTDCGVLAARVRRRLTEVATAADLVVVVDGIDQIDAVEGVTATDWIPDIWPDRLRVFVSTRSDGPIPGLPEHASSFSLPRVQPSEAGQLLRAIFAEHSKDVSEEHVAALLRKEESSSLLYLALAAEELRTVGRFEVLGVQIAELPGSIEPLLLSTLDRLARETSFRDTHGNVIGAELIEATASLLTSSRCGLSPRELQELIEPNDSLGNLASLLRSIRSWMVESGDLLWFRHPRIAEAVQGRYLVDSKATHGRLADYFRAGLADPRPQHRGRPLTELPFHLFHAGRIEELWELARSDAFLDEQRAVHSGARTIVSQTLSLALEGACRKSRPKEMAEFVLRTGNRLGGNRSQRLLEALQGGLSDLSSVPEPGEELVLWPLLFAAELLSRNRVEAAQAALRKLRLAELSGLADRQRWMALALLADAWTVDPKTAIVLTRALLDDTTRAQLAIELEIRGGYGAAAEVCGLIVETHGRFNAFQSLAEELLKSGLEDDAHRLFDALTSALAGSVLTTAPEFAVIEASATALSGSPERAVEALYRHVRQVTALQRAWVVARAAWGLGRKGQIKPARDHFDQLRSLAEGVLQQREQDDMLSRIWSAWIWLLVAEWGRDSMEAAYVEEAIVKSWSALGDPRAAVADCIEDDAGTPGETHLQYLERVLTGVAVASARSNDVLDPMELEEVIQRLRPEQRLRAWLELGRVHAERSSADRSEHYWQKVLAHAHGRTTAAGRGEDLATAGNILFHRYGQDRGRQALAQARKEIATSLAESDLGRELYAPLAIAYARAAAPGESTNANRLARRRRALDLLARASSSDTVVEDTTAVMLRSEDFEAADRALQLIPEADRPQSLKRLADRMVQAGRESAVRRLAASGLLPNSHPLETAAQFHKALQSADLGKARELLRQSPTLLHSHAVVDAWIRALCATGDQAEATDVLDTHCPVTPETMGAFDRTMRASSLLQRAIWLAETGRAEEAERVFQASEQELGIARSGFSVFRMMAGLSATEVSRLDNRDHDFDAMEGVVRTAPLVGAMARGGAGDRARELLRTQQAALDAIRLPSMRSRAAFALATVTAEAGEFETMLSLTDLISDRRAERLEAVVESAWTWRDRLEQHELLEVAITPLLKHAAPRLDVGIRLCGLLAEMFPTCADELSSVLDRIAPPTSGMQ